MSIYVIHSTKSSRYVGTSVKAQKTEDIDNQVLKNLYTMKSVAAGFLTPR